MATTKSQKKERKKKQPVNFTQHRKEKHYQFWSQCAERMESESCTTCVQKHTYTYSQSRKALTYERAGNEKRVGIEGKVRQRVGKSNITDGTK